MLSSRKIWAVRDHPRTRGDKYSSRTNVPLSTGSPPHTRGQDACSLSGFSQYGITPAHAGTSLVKFAFALPHEDHPRTRGDKDETQKHQEKPPGSPPHTRGQGESRSTEARRVGITPAHAGTRRKQKHRSPARRDHPRTRGDKPAPSAGTKLKRGSPPHTRGQGCFFGCLHYFVRITPAHAGTSIRMHINPMIGKDHPRTRGDKRYADAARQHGRGSPPHTRGQGKDQLNKATAERITPAHAGTSLRRRAISCPTSDHPRTRGDKRPRRRPMLW